ncbi:MAG: carbohydrate-binding protein [Firmicutes bacterium]|nr:carbohydrate-binding protein [Bacillota bacterium]
MLELWRRLGRNFNEEYGIEVSPTPITAGETVTVRYNGTLAEQGAKQITLHAGYGTGDNWEEVFDVPMTKQPDGSWTAEVAIDTDSQFHFCFTDGKSWDNNYGKNWTYEVHNGLNPGK